jgi:hypothetical protein
MRHQILSLKKEELRITRSPNHQIPKFQWTVYGSLSVNGAIFASNSSPPRVTIW